MGLKNHTSRFSGKTTKERWLLLLLIGVLLTILLFPLPGNQKKDKGKENQTTADSQGPGAVPLWTGNTQDPAQTGESSMFGSLSQGHMSGGSSEDSKGDLAYPTSASSDEEGPYETQMENRIRNLFKSVNGVGKVGVMTALESSSEKVIKVDRFASSSVTQEKDSGGGIKEVTSNQSDESTVLSSSDSDGSGNVPIIEKELSLEISGVIISMEGGGSPTIEAETFEATEALFGLPPHKIKVLKRVE